MKKILALVFTAALMVGIFAGCAPEQEAMVTVYRLKSDLYLIDASNEQNYKSSFSHTYTYDTDGDVLGYTFVYHLGAQEPHTHTYPLDENGEPRLSDIWPTITPPDRETRDSLGRLTSVLWFSQGNGINIYYEFLYDPTGMVITINHYGYFDNIEAKELSGIYIYELDHNGNIIREHITDKNLKSTREYRWKYDEQSRLIAYWVGADTVPYMEFTYDENGCLLTHKTRGMNSWRFNLRKYTYEAVVVPESVAEKMIDQRQSLWGLPFVAIGVGGVLILGMY